MSRCSESVLTVRYKVQLVVAIEVETEDGREALPAALNFFQEAIDWSTEHYEGAAIKEVEVVSGTLTTGAY